MPSRLEIVTFDDSPPPAGQSAFVPGVEPDVSIAISDYDPAWPERFDEIASRVRTALGSRALVVEHVGSTSVPGLPAKPVIDVDLTVADPAAEARYVPALEAAGFVLRVREPWWHEHRLLRLDGPRVNLHVFGPDSAEAFRHRLFRDWLRHEPDERKLYAATKREAADAANAGGEDVLQYNARKEAVVREIYQRLFAATGLVD